MSAASDVPLTEKQARAEHQLSYVRASVALFNSVVFLALPSAGASRWLGYVLILLGLGYSAFTLLAPARARSRRLPPYFTTLVDSLLISAWVAVTGGAHSPFIPLWYGSIVAVALRFDLRHTVVTGVAYAVSHVVIVVALGQMAETRVETMVNASYMVFVGVAAGFGARFRVNESLARIEATSLVASARAGEAKFRGLIEFSPDPVVVVDPMRRVVLMNETAEATFQVKRADFLGRDVSELLDPATRGAYAAWHDATLAGPGAARATATAFRGLRGDAAFPLEIFASHYEAEGGRHLICVMRDVTQRLAAEEERIAGAERLREIERLKEMDRFRTQFINNAAHELNTPMTPIKIQVHMLEAGRERLDPQQRRAVEILKRNVERLGGLVQDLLDVARAQAERLVIVRKPVELGRLVREAVESFEEPARRQGVRLVMDVEPDVTLSADEKRLTQVLFNLLSNALKFTPEGGEVAVTARRRGDEAVLVVRDSGIGIDPALQHRLFQPFSQLHDPKERTRAGSGLGLYITRSLVELHGGRITLQSEGAGRGTTFTVAIPLAPPAAPSPARPVQVRRPARVAPASEARNDMRSRIDELI